MKHAITLTVGLLLTALVGTLDFRRALAQQE